ncbi:wall-associated receptor kinase-like 14 [Salvia miltiorrhiza]|uniref:wall-associated receptor kinase-like 14 n=1 Tax=Salvia miltiorrhiza TaxID=226208 RepID=UPI0025AD96BB|nr:wall-associated receptor kinase-like 14 [Salvia miltiorrhiza]
MKLKFHTCIIFIVIHTVLTITYSSAALCNHTCGGRKLPFPFGFSAGCQIQLNCSANGTILAAGFAVQSVNAETILVKLPALCGRSVEALRRLFTANFAPTSHNAILLHDCLNPSSGCLIPTTMVQTHFEQLDCDARNATISCYSEPDNATSFIDYGNLTRSGCRSLFSAISMAAYSNSSSVSLDVEVVRVGWWLRGDCRCSRNARCVPVSPPLLGGDTPAYRCECFKGFAGDGFLDGVGCRKESQACNPSNYLSGKCGGTTRVGVLVGGVGAGALLMVSLGLLFCFIRKRSKVRSRSKKSRKLLETTGINIPIYSYKEMEKAADFFSEKRRLGNGAYGTVYCGKLSNDEWVAIKRIRHRDAGDTLEQVINEIKLLSSVSHPNLVRLLGCSIEKEQQILVYEFMPNGTLSQHLQREKGSVLPWPVRLTIAAETAQAISYLHNATHPPIYHRDIKSTNILLDAQYRAKVADFGLSRLGTMLESSHVSTAPQGTPGYLDPQYHQHFHLSDKSDVYSFGVVLIEIITALRVVDFGRPQNEVNLAALAVDRIGKGRLDEIVDPFLEPSADLSVHKVAELAFRCLAFHRDMRPSMMEVAIELEQIRLSKWSVAVAEKPFNLVVKKHDYDSSGFFGSTNSVDTVTDSSPVSAADSWQSDQTSPSSNTLLNRSAT